MKESILKASIKIKMMLIMFGVIFAFVLISIALNSLFLKPYYTRLKEESLYESYRDIVSMDFTSEKISQKLIEMEESRNIEINILNDSPESENPETFFISRFGRDLGYSITMSEEQYKQFIQDWYGFKYGGQDSYAKSSIISSHITRMNETTKLSIYANTTKVEDGVPIHYFIIIKTPLVAIEDGTNAANRFTVLVGIVLIAVGGMITFIAGEKFTEPIVRACYAAEQVAGLNFSIKLPVRSNDEIGMLSISINNLSDQLSSKIEELSIANRQLQKELERKQKVDDMRREFISDVSHELKTPLAIILGYCEGLQMNINSEEREYYCSVIQDEAQRMSSLSARLLKVAELETGEIDPEMSEFDLGNMVSDRLTKLGLLLEERGVKTQISVECDSLVYADYERIEEVVNNLLTNAKNHTPDGGVISVRITSKDRETLVCHVHNTGSHIPEESLDKIWESFYKVDKARTRAYGGSGLGLKIVRTILDAHGSEYGAINTDTGVEFFFTMKKAVPGTEIVTGEETQLDAGQYSGGIYNLSAADAMYENALFVDGYFVDEPGGDNNKQDQEGCEHNE